MSKLTLHHMETDNGYIRYFMANEVEAYCEDQSQRIKDLEDELKDSSRRVVFANNVIQHRRSDINKLQADNNRLKGMLDRIAEQATRYKRACSNKEYLIRDLDFIKQIISENK